MRFLANENVPRSAVHALRAAGQDISWIRSDAPGLTDEAVLARARVEGRVLLTFDKDFGELVLKRGASASRGVVLFRIPLSRPLVVGQTVARAIASTIRLGRALQCRQGESRADAGPRTMSGISTPRCLPMALGVHNPEDRVRQDGTACAREVVELAAPGCSGPLSSEAGDRAARIWPTRGSCGATSRPYRI